MSILSVLFFVLSFTRRYTIHKIRSGQRKGNDFSFIHPDSSLLQRGNQVNLPFITVVMPCKGVHEQSYSNWSSQIVSLYGGPMEFIFIVESTSDPAYNVITRIIEENNNNDITLKVGVSGLSWHNSQKIHNQLYGISMSNPESRYIAFIDDDIQLHPGTMFALVHEIESDPQVFVSTGYSFEAPVRGAPFVNYMIYFYRMINLIGFITPRPSFAWGGCLLLRRADFFNNSYGITDIWRDGGYSDDTIAANIARKTGRKIGASPYAIFPATLPNTHTFWKSYVNFVRRQYYVLDTYFSVSDKYLNYIQTFELVIASLIFALPTLILFIQFFITIFSLMLNISIPSKFLSMFLIQVLVCIINVISQYYMAHILTILVTILAPQREKIQTYLSPIYVLLGTLCHALMLPILAVSSVVYDKANWAGVVYEKCGGRVKKMERLDGTKGDWVKSLKMALDYDAKFGLVKPPNMDVDWNDCPRDATTKHLTDKVAEMPPIVVASWEKK